MPKGRMNKTKRKVNRSKPKSNYNTSRRAYSHMELIRPISLKPKSVIKRFVYYNKAHVVNALDQTGPNAVNQTQFYRINLNSPWIFNSEVFARENPTQGTMPGCRWDWNQPVTVRTHDSLAPNKYGTSMPGVFNPDGGQPNTVVSSYVGDNYKNAYVVGTKWTIQFTPLASVDNESNDPTAAFAIIETDQSVITSQTKIDDLYNRPYVQVRKLAVGSNYNAQKNGATQPCRIVVKYSPKRMNNIKDLRDNVQFANHLSTVESTPTANLPAERDSLCFGIVPTLSNKQNKNKLVNHYVEVKCEQTILFTEPTSNTNVALGQGANLASSAGVFISQAAAVAQGLMSASV